MTLLPTIRGYTQFVKKLDKSEQLFYNSYPFIHPDSRSWAQLPPPHTVVLRPAATP
ncbi:MAG: hypothetical protein HF973_04855 [Chloroflexi bacterium]|nr:hypothetical protein [Chloroflexota bacterium]